MPVQNLVDTSPEWNPSLSENATVHSSDQREHAGIRRSHPQWRSQWISCYLCVLPSDGNHNCNRSWRSGTNHSGPERPNLDVGARICRQGFCCWSLGGLCRIVVCLFTWRLWQVTRFRHWMVEWFHVPGHLKRIDWWFFSLSERSDRAPLNVWLSRRLLFSCRSVNPACWVSFLGWRRHPDACATLPSTSFSIVCWGPDIYPISDHQAEYRCRPRAGAEWVRFDWTRLSVRTSQRAPRYPDANSTMTLAW